ncbi:NAD kinase [uncultured archaeon]|nr:NAD kinase [uncultured archaeon]
MGKVKIGITGRKQNPPAIEAGKNAIMQAMEKGAAVEIDTEFMGRGNLRPLDSGEIAFKPLQKFNSGIVLSFGGDGTLLRTARDLEKKAIIAGINFGRTGFLQAFHSGEIEKALNAAIAGNILAEERTRILTKVDGKKAGEALNEILIVPAKAGRILHCQLKIGKDERDEGGDGLIIATPTGSTAHAFSAGGPVIRGNAKVFVVVSISPTDSRHRPLVVNDNGKITVSNFGGKAEAIIDGQVRVPIRKKIELSKGRSIMLAVKPYF